MMHSCNAPHDAWVFWNIDEESEISYPIGHNPTMLQILVMDEHQCYNELHMLIK